MNFEPQNKKMFKHEKEQLKRLAENTLLTQKEIGDALGVSKPTVSLYINKMNLSSSNRRIPLKKMAKIIRYVLSGKSKQRICDELNTCNKSINRIIDAYSIDYESNKGKFEVMELFEISDKTENLVDDYCSLVPENVREEVKKRTIDRIREYAEHKDYKYSHIRRDKRRDVTKGGFLIVCRNMGIDVGEMEMDDAYRYMFLEVDGVVPQKPTDVCRRLLDKFDVSDNIGSVAMDTAEIINEYPTYYIGKSLVAIAGACIYHAMNKVGSSMTQESVSRKVNTTTVSLRARVDELHDIIRKKELDVKDK